MKTVGKNFVNYPLSRILLLNFLALLFMACEPEPTELVETADRKMNKHTMAGPYEFSAPVYDIASTPDGGILVGLNDGTSRSIQIIRKGEVSTMIEIDAASDIHGIAALGGGNAFVTTAGSDLAMNGELYRVSRGNARIVADLAAFERENDPDAFEGLQWKDQLCEGTGGFSPGPQNIPIKLLP